MTIKFVELNRRWTYLERCAEVAPEGLYERTKEAANAVADASQGILDALRRHGFKAKNGDKLRDLEALIYGYLLESNPEDGELHAAEGFGEYVDGPLGERIMQDAKRSLEMKKAFGF